MLRQRVITALIMAAIVLSAIFFLPSNITAIIITLVILVGAWEWSAFAGLKTLGLRLVYVAAIAVALFFLWRQGVESPRASQVLDGAVIWWCVALIWVIALPTRVSPASAAIAGLLVLLPAWLALVRLQQTPTLLLFVLLLVVAADVGAYFAGRRFGRHKLAPKVSPGKTWEGALGGLVAALVMAGIGAFWFKFDAVPFVLMCAGVAVASIVGDLTESMFKRHAGLKDSGTILPGHGGVLDRVDSVTAAAPIFLFGMERLGLLF